MMWSQPSFAPQRYEGYCQCRRLCEKTYDLSLSVDSSPYIFTGIDPGSECTIGLNGIYGSEPAGLGLGIITTLSSGKLCYIIIFTIIILLSYYSQHPLHLSVISLYHQLRQRP